MGSTRSSIRGHACPEITSGRVDRPRDKGCKEFADYGRRRSVLSRMALNAPTLGNVSLAVFMTIRREVYVWPVDL